MAEDPDEIARERRAIDTIDESILELLNRRAAAALRIGQLKERSRGPVLVPGRELDIFERLEARNSGPFPAEGVRNVFREIISVSYALEKGMKVAYFGPAATYTHQAAIQQFGRMVELEPMPTIADIFEAVEAERAAYGVVPVENSTEGVVSHTLDLFVDSPLTITAEIQVAIHHDLLSRVSDLHEVRAVYSHPQALAQCREWLSLNLPGVSQYSTASTAAAAERVTREEGAAAIASPVAAEIYGLRAIRRGIEDRASNTTRFLVISTTPPDATERDITSLLFSIKRDQIGALYHALEPFASHGVNLTRIESRPTKARAWEYLFFCDFEGNARDPEVAAAIAELEPRCDFVKVLGSYPRAAP
ncbi:MAG: prephenate dehydratase [Myxococcota bacterium]